MTIKSFRDLFVWQTAMDLATEVYAVTRGFPRSETYGLMSQLQRAAVSIASNIAEGHGRRSTAEFLRSLMIAMGSLAELETQVMLAERLNYLDSAGASNLLEKANEIGRMVRSLHSKLQGRIRPALATSH